MGVRIVVANKEPIGLALKRFKKTVERHGIDWEVRRRQYFVRMTEKRRAKKFQKRFRTRKAALPVKLAGKETAADSSAKLKNDFWQKTGKP